MLVNISRQFWDSSKTFRHNLMFKNHKITSLNSRKFEKNCLWILYKKVFREFRMKFRKCFKKLKLITKKVNDLEKGWNLF